LLVGGVARLTWCGRLARSELARRFARVGAAVWRSIVSVFIFRVGVVGILRVIGRRFLFIVGGWRGCC
jgi:hypothetical protein